MTFKQLLKNSLFHFDELKKSKNASLWKLVLFLLLFSLIMALPLSVQVVKVFQSIQKDSEKIAQQVPDFTVENGTLQTDDSEGFIYQTDSIIFTFDPEGKRTAKDVSEDMLGNLFSVGLLKDELVVSLPTNEITTAVMGDTQLTFPYTQGQLKNLSGSNLRNVLTNTQLSWWMYLVILFVAFYPTFLNLLITLLTTALIANIYSHFKRLTYRFFDNFKIIIACSAWPTIVSAIISTFFFNFDGFTFIIISTFFLYTVAVKNSEKITPPQK